MAKQRFSLNETMSDAVTNIEEAKASNIETASNIEANPNIPEKDRVEEVPRLERIRKKINKSEEYTNMRNVPLSDNMLEKLESIKKYLNKNRITPTNDTFVSVGELLNIAAQEFLDKYWKQGPEKR